MLARSLFLGAGTVALWLLTRAARTFKNDIGNLAFSFRTVVLGLNWVKPSEEVEVAWTTW